MDFLERDNIYKREKYLNKIRGFYNDTEIIKVISGVRRCGKSSLMKTIVYELLDNNISQNQIIFIELDSKKYKNVKSPDELEKIIDSLSTTKEIKYLFIDEIQNIKDFEKVINSYREEGDYSIFITGSNSYLLSGELITKLTGRYIEFEITTLTFDEYIEIKKFFDKEVSVNYVEEFDKYILEGGFPKTIQYDSMQDKRTYVKSIISEILEKDVIKRVKIKNKLAFERVSTYIINNFGQTTSIKNIREELLKQNINIKENTLYKYIEILEDAKIIYECKRFDLKSKKSLKGEKKYYLADTAFYFTNNTDNRINYGPILENIIYFYAKSKGYEISIGKFGNLECDFILRSPEFDYSYVQIAMTIMNSKETEDREYKILEEIKDNYPKYVLTRSDMIQKRNGIIHKNIPNLIINNEDF